MRIYITGIEGLIGSALARQHLRQGDDVFGCDIRKAPSKYSRLDIRHQEALEDDIRLKVPDRVYHCAAMLGVQNTETYPDLCRQINEDGTTNVAEACRSAGVAELVFLSSSEVYGHGYDFKPFSETSPLTGDNVYAVSKKKGEITCLLHKNYMKVIIARMFNCFGPYQVAQFFIPKAIQLCLADRAVPIYGSFDNKRAYLFSHDAARYIMDVANIAAGGEIVNIAHPDTYTLGSVFDMVAKACGGGAASLRVGRYDDRDVSRDVPNRVAVIHKMQAYSKHVPVKLPDAINFTASLAQSLRDDWDYKRTVL